MVELLKQKAMLRLHKSLLRMIKAFMESDCNKALGHLLQGEGVFVATPRMTRRRISCTIAGLGSRSSFCQSFKFTAISQTGWA
jgi:hypothetical protein